MWQVTEHVEIVIVGAGLAGLVATHTLSCAGRSVVCLEARDQVGGRVASIKVGDGAVDLGASWIWPGEPAVRSFTERFGVPLHAQSTAGNALLDRGEIPEQLAGNPIDRPSSRFTNGAQDLPVRIAATLPEGTVRLSQPVASIHTHPGGVSAHTPEATYEADHVLVALPPALAVDSIDFVPDLPSDVLQGAREASVWMGQTVKAVAVYGQPFWRAAGWSGSAISYRGPFAEFHDHSGPDHQPAALFAFGPADRFAGVSTEVVVQRFREQLRHLFGEQAAEPTQVHVCDWSRERYTTPARPSPTASPQNFGHPLLQQPVLDGRVSWAATETATAYAGHLEGAVRAGIKAARDHLDRTASATSSTSANEHT